MTIGELGFVLQVMGRWPWIISGSYALLITIFAMPRMLKAPHRSLPISPVTLGVGGAAFLMTLIGTIQAADGGALTDQGVSNILSFIVALVVLGGLTGFAAMAIGAWIVDLRSKV